MLNSQEDVVCHGELFKPTRIELDECYLGQLNYKKSEVERREKDPITFYNKVCRQSKGNTIGFKIFPSHNKAIFKYLLFEKDIKIIFLARNPIQSYTSLMLARKTGRWIYTHDRGGEYNHNKVKVDIDNLFRHIYHQKMNYEYVRSICRVTGKELFTIEYSQLKDRRTIDQLAGHLGLSGWASVPSKYKKQNQRKYREIITNYSEIEKLSKYGIDLQMPFFEFLRNINTNLLT